jgi:hypothetical protein
VRSPKERCRRLPEYILDGPLRCFQLLAQSTGWAEGEEPVVVAMARDLVTVGYELRQELRMGPHVRPEDEERGAVAASGQQRADLRCEARIGAVVEGECELRLIRPCARNAPEQKGVRRERSEEVGSSENRRETEK